MIATCILYLLHLSLASSGVAKSSTSPSDSFFTILALYKFNCMYVCKDGKVTAAGWHCVIQYDVISCSCVVILDYVPLYFSFASLY